MSKIVKLIVNYCIQCPYVDYNEHGRRCKLSDKMSNDYSHIPDWCELEDED